MTRAPSTDGCRQKGGLYVQSFVFSFVAGSAESRTAEEAGEIVARLFGFDASRIPVAECLIKHGADVNAVSPLDGFRPIHLVTMPNRVDLIRFYVANGVDVDSRSVECQGLDISECNRGPCSGTHDRTPLMVACGEGFIEAVKCLLDLGANVNARNSAGQTPLHFAARRFWPKRPYDAIIDVLLSRGADKNALDDVGRSP